VFQVSIKLCTVLSVRCGSVYFEACTSTGQHNIGEGGHIYTLETPNITLGYEFKHMN